VGLAEDSFDTALSLSPSNHLAFHGKATCLKERRAEEEEWNQLITIMESRLTPSEGDGEEGEVDVIVEEEADDDLLVVPRQTISQLPSLHHSLFLVLLILIPPSSHLPHIRLTMLWGRGIWHSLTWLSTI